MNIAIIAALVIQGVIKNKSRLAGAIAGYVVTTGILLWGLSVYLDGYWIEIFGYQLSRAVFVVAILAWYAFDTLELIKANTEAKQKAKAQNQEVLKEYENFREKHKLDKTTK